MFDEKERKLWRKAVPCGKQLRQKLRRYFCETPFEFVRTSVRISVDSYTASIEDGLSTDCAMYDAMSYPEHTVETTETAFVGRLRTLHHRSSAN